MYCPYCFSPATRQDVNGTLFVGLDEENECFDPNVSMFQCDRDGNHVFFADDGNDNAAVEPDEDEDGGEGTVIGLASFEDIFGKLTGKRIK